MSYPRFAPQGPEALSDGSIDAQDGTFDDYEECAFGVMGANNSTVSSNARMRRKTTRTSRREDDVHDAVEEEPLGYADPDWDG